MKNLKKIISLLAVSALLLTAAGCRTKGEGETTGNSAATQKPQQKIELVFWSLFDPCDLFRGQIQEFESKNQGYKINCKKFSNAEEYEKVLINEIAEGRGPDIFSLKNTTIAKHKGKITPMPAEIMVPEKFRDTFFAVAADDLLLKNNEGLEQIYGIPLYVDTLALYYNKQLFRDNLPSTDKPAETWEEIKEQVYALTKKDNSIERFAVVGLAAGRADNIQRAIDILSLVLIQQGTKMYENDKPIFALQQGTLEGTGKPYFPGVEALKLYTGFGLPSYKNYSWNDLITSFSGDQKEVGVFVRGKAGMIFGYSYLYDEIDLQIQAAQKKGTSHIAMEDIGIAPVPQLVKPDSSGKQDALASYFPLTVSRNSREPAKAWEFINLLASPGSLQDYHQKTHRPTSRKDMIEEQSLEAIFGVFARQASYAKSLPTIDDAAFKAIFEEAVNSVAKSKKTPEEALAIAQRKMDCVLKKAKDPTLDTTCAEAQ